MRIPFTDLHVGRIEAKSSAASPLVYVMYSGQTWGVYTKRDFAQYSDDAYKRNSAAYMSINRVARGCAGINWKIMQGADHNGRGGKELDGKHPLCRLFRRPNPFQSGRDLKEALVAYLMLSGNTFVEGVGPDGKPPLELFVPRVDRIKVIPGPMGPAGYVYDVNGQRKTWDIDPITGGGPMRHIKFFNPLDDWYGMSPVEAAAFSVDAHNMAGEWNQALLQNGCKPSGALIYKPSEANPANLAIEQRASLKEQINGAMAGSRNAGRALLLEGNFDWKQMSMSPSDMDWINGKNMNSREICTVFGVPPMLLGIPGDNTYSNYQEARQSFYEDTILPLDAMIAEHFSQWLLPAYGDDLMIVQDINDLPALSGKRKERWDAVTNATWMTINEKRQAVGMDDYDDENADKIWVPTTITPMDMATEIPDPSEMLPVGGEPEGPGEDAEPEDDEEGAPAGKPASGKKPPFGEKPPFGGKK
jgi:HK97 family phage portal protein